MPTDPTAAEQQLKTLLTELLQLDDAARLDFGIYKILALRREELSRFLDTLAGEVRAELLASGARSHEAAKAAVAEFVSGSLKLGWTYDDIYATARHKTLTEQLAGAIEPGQLAQEVFESLVTFFARYWDEGDFIAAPRYSRDQYAIPYDGSEVALHWANRDQYYVKSSLFLNDMVVKEPHFPGRLVIKLVSAVSDRDNVKAADANKRRFMLADDGQPDVVAEGDDLTLRLRYAPTAPPAAAAPPKAKGKKKAEPEAEAPAEPGRAPKQDLLNVVIAEALLAAASPAWRAALSRPAGPEKDAESTLTRHLRRYTKQNTADFFIHKNLGRFLRRELDFYIKNELFDLDHIDTVSEDTLRKRVVKVRALRRLAVKLIDWLHQLEEFQRRLFLKKKFVLRTDWAITLDRVPRALWPEIAQNKAQVRRWRDLFKIDALAPTLFSGGGGEADTVTVEFLEQNVGLVVETGLFERHFSTQIMLNESTLCEPDGTLIHAANFHALTAIQDRYLGQIAMIYAYPPPYSTQDAGFPHKNGYKRSTWAAMVSQILPTLRKLLSEQGVTSWATDDTESGLLRAMLDEAFGGVNFAGTVAVEVNPAGQNIRDNVPARSHDYFHIYANSIESSEMQLRTLTADEEKQYKLSSDDGAFIWDNLRRRGGNSRPSDRPKQYFPLYASLTPPRVELSPFPGSTEIFPIDPKGEQRIWRNNRDGVVRDLASGRISVISKAGRMEIVKKSFMPEGNKKWKTIWTDSRYSATSHGTKLLLDMIPRAAFSYPKSLHLVSDCVTMWASEEGTIIDPFAGSGTTGHAVINLNREDGGDRRFVLVEMGDHFDTVLVPRVLKATYSKDWKDGAPVDRKGVSALYKILRLESYDDTLENITLRRDDSSRAVLFDKDGQPTTLGESYLLKYQLALESRASRLQSERFDKPFHATLKALAPRPDGRGGVAVQAVPVDMVETFNLLLGLRARRMWSMTNDGQQAVLVSGVVRDGADWTTPVVVLWWDTQDVKEETLVSWLKGLRAREDDVIGPARLRYVNGDASFSRLWAEDEPWTPLEPEFQRRMFDVAEEG
jgi:adenine-specific DNA-methyltransferase